MFVHLSLGQVMYEVKKLKTLSSNMFSFFDCVCKAGPRICLGKDFAYRQMKIVSMVLLHFFRFKMADEKSNVRYKRMLTLHIEGGLHLHAIPRTSSWFPLMKQLFWDIFTETSWCILWFCMYPKKKEFRWWKLRELFSYEERTYFFMEKKFYEQ